MVIAGVIPIALLAGERKRLYKRRAEVNREAVSREERNRTVLEWQAAWDEEPRGRWTARLIKDVSISIRRSFGEVDFYLTQLLSGHGLFRAYLKRMGKEAQEDCIYCPPVKGDAYHTFFFVCVKGGVAYEEI
uniref:Reverse transcriptase zinc-binding domain-containing protein n=1 Tax=Rhodnius prolixus TaxID=13249 RepID=T1HQ86_RHOPR